MPAPDPVPAPAQSTQKDTPPPDVTPQARSGSGWLPGLAPNDSAKDWIFLANETVTPETPWGLTAAPQFTACPPGYEILGELGRGGMGVVYKAKHLGLERVVALKMILGGAHADPAEHARFHTEARAVAKLHHPNIVQIFDVGTNAGLPYCALELVPGGSLDCRLQGRPIPPRDAALLLAPLADAIHAAHEAGIVHRDLKPANVLLQIDDCRLPNADRTGNSTAVQSSLINWQSAIPKVSDFGLAKQLGSQEQRTATGAVVGTPAYMAPEQAAGKNKEVGPAADIYALGVILYEMLTGRVPFNGVTYLEILQQVQNTEPVAPIFLQPGVPVDLNTICLKCLEKDPSRRYATAQALAEDVRRFLANRPILARPVSRTERLRKWARRQPALAGLVATIFLGIVALIAGVVLLLNANARESQLRADAQANERLARQEQAKAQEARREAQAKYRLARQAVDDLFNAVTDTPLLRQQAMQPVRKMLLERAVPFYEQFLAEHRNDPALVEEAAASYARLGYVRRMIGNRPEARHALQEAVRLWQQAMAANPATFRFPAELADTWRMLGNAQNEAGDQTQALHSYQEARQVLEKLIAADATEPAHRASLASTWRNLGGLYQEIGQDADAEQAFRKALHVSEELARAHPDREDFQTSLAGAWNALAGWHLDRRQLVEAERGYQEALRLWTQLVAARPDVAESQSELAEVWNNLGIVHKLANRKPEALRCFQQALAMQEKLVAAFPLQTDYQTVLGNICNGLGSIHADLEQPPQARASYERAMQVWDRLIQAHPTITEFHLRRGGSACNLGHLLLNSAPAKAETWYTKAIESLQPLRQKEPRHPVVKQFLKNAHQGRAVAYKHLQKHMEAAKDWEQAMLLVNEPSWEITFRLAWAAALARAGDHAGAATVVREMPPHLRPNAGHLLEVARAYALCHAAATNQPTLQDQYATHALTALREAQAKGWFKKAQNLKALDQDEEFATLRQHASYLAWRQTVR